METLKTFNLGLSFLLELVLAAAVGYCAYALPLSFLLKIAVTILGPVILIIFWGQFLAPRARTRLDMPGLLIVKLALFGGVAAALYAIGRPGLAATFAILIFVNMAGVIAWKQF